MGTKNVATKKKVRTGNRSKLVLDAVHAQFKPHEPFHGTTVEVEGLDYKQVGSALSMLVRKGMIVRGALKGYYSLPNGTKSINPAQAIYDLLDFMAKAEPSLKRAAKILEAVDHA